MKKIQQDIPLSEVPQDVIDYVCHQRNNHQKRGEDIEKDGYVIYINHNGTLCRRAVRLTEEA